MPKNAHSITFLFGLLLFSHIPSFAQQTGVNAQPIANNLEIPWDLEYWGTDTLLFTQKNGEIIRLDLRNSALDTLRILNNVAVLQHSGLMGMALHPAWPDTQSVFVAYAFYGPQFQVFVRLQRLDYDAAKDSLMPGITMIDDIPGAATTTGARVITSQNYVFLSTGDVNLGSPAQDTSSLAGKILRVHVDGSIPQDNPFPGSPVWTLGHRNPQGLALGPQGNFFSCEHGASANDELNLIQKGRNYGWPNVSGFCSGEPACQELNLVDPLQTWSPPIAPCGLAYVDTAQVLTNGLLMAGLRGNALYWIKLNNNQDGVERIDTLLPSQIGRIRDVLVTRDNRIFISTSNTESQVPTSPQDDQIFELFTGFLSNERVEENMPVSVFVSNGKLNLKHENQFGVNDSWNLYSLGGNLVKNAAIPLGSSQIQADLSQLPSGYYFVAVQSSQGQFYQKIYLAPR